MQGAHIETIRTITKAPFEWNLGSSMLSPQLGRLLFDNMDWSLIKGRVKSTSKFTMIFMALGLL